MVDTAFDANLSTEKSCKSWISKGASGTFWGQVTEVVPDKD